MLGARVHKADAGNTELYNGAIQGTDITDAQPEPKPELQTALVAMVPIPGGSKETEGQLVRDLLAEFPRDFFLRLCYWYQAGRHLPHLQPCASLELIQQ